jgi:hypothetical protein
MYHLSLFCCTQSPVMATGSNQLDPGVLFTWLRRNWEAGRPQSPRMMQVPSHVFSVASVQHVSLATLRMMPTEPTSGSIHACSMPPVQPHVPSGGGGGEGLADGW